MLTAMAGWQFKSKQAIKPAPGTEDHNAVVSGTNGLMDLGFRLCSSVGVLFERRSGYLLPSAVNSCPLSFNTPCSSKASALYCSVLASKER